MAEEIARQVREEVNRIRAKVEAEARLRGEADGRAKLIPEHTALAAALMALNETAGQLAAPLARKEADLADLVTELAFILAHHVIGVEVSVRPASLHALVTKVISEAAAEKGPRQSLVLRLNPDDYAYLRPLITEETATLEASDTIARGGAVVEIVTPEGDPINKIEWDATIRSRMETVRDALILRADGSGILK